MRFYGDINQWEFYDLQSDPGEMKNRIDDPSVQPIVAELKSRLVRLRRTYRDSDGPLVDQPLTSKAAIEKGWRDADSAAGSGHHAHH